MFCSFSFYYNSKNLNYIWALSFFYDSKRSIGEVLFLINFIGVNFEAGIETREKFGLILLLNKLKNEAKREWFFVHIAVF